MSLLFQLDIQCRLIGPNQFSLNPVPVGHLRNHHHMDMGGPQPNRRRPILMVGNPILEAFSLSNIECSPLVLRCDTCKNVDSGYIIPGYCFRVIDLELVC